MRKLILAAALCALSVLAVAMDPIQLLAGQDKLAGYVTITNNSNNLLVTYHCLPGWLLFETHVAISNDPSTIPQKNENPTPGKFNYKAIHTPPVSSFTYTIPKPAYTPIYIAVHAVVDKATSGTLTLDSGLGTKVVRIMPPEVIVNHDLLPAEVFPAPPAEPADAFLAWEPYADATPSFWDINLDYPDDESEFGGWPWDWVWSEYRVENPNPASIGLPLNAWNYYYSVEFLHEFTIPGTPTDGTLWITCDNFYKAGINGVYEKGGLPWMADNVLLPSQQDNTTLGGWRTIEKYDIGAGDLVPGLNALNVIGTNDGTDWYSQLDNPAGVLYHAVINYISYGGHETAWADGTDFGGANWATYVTYNWGDNTVSD